MPTLLVTGANRGIGLELARQYAADGWEVVATAREPDKADELNDLDCKVETLDVADQTSVDAFLERLGDRKIDLFINNAGVGGGLDLTRETWLHTLEVNSVAPALLARALKPNVAASDRKKMVVITSRMGSIADNDGGGFWVYRSSKAAVNAAWKSIALDFKGDGIAVAMLHPGWVQTDMGGPNAQIDTATSVAGMRKVIDGLSLDNTGEFRAYDGAAIDW
ncbi:MAG: SDR family oxidoreductase [Parasphingopyxis sp.]|nr:SDR family oxidoreductase [Sphingomonadales bacterium]